MATVTAADGIQEFANVGMLSSKLFRPFQWKKGEANSDAD